MMAGMVWAAQPLTADRAGAAVSLPCHNNARRFFMPHGV